MYQHRLLENNYYHYFQNGRDHFSKKKDDIQPSVVYFTIISSNSYSYYKYLAIKNDKFETYPSFIIGMVKSLIDIYACFQKNVYWKFK